MNLFTRRRLLVISSVFLATAAFAQNQSAPKPYGALPTARQLKWQETEMYCIIHFTPTTYQNKEWGYGDADPAIFNPKKFDAVQIVSAAKSGGFKGIVYVAKHHDGFALWPTKTASYNISESPWKDGKGDMVKEFMLAAKQEGMKFGIYCSPWDRNNPTYGTLAYLTVYRAQLKELYSNYGDLFMSWHDGANGGDGYYGGKNEQRKVDQSQYYDWLHTWEMTRKLQPNANIFSDIGLDVRWVGNEMGQGPETSWSTIDLVGKDGKPAMPGFMDDANLGSGTRGGKQWIPFEGDVALRPGWFYHPEQDNKLKTTAELFAIYCSSVGHGGALDLGLSPTTDGILHPNDVKALADFGQYLKQVFVHNMAKDATIAVSNVRGKQQSTFGTSKLTDTDRYSYWATDDAVHQASATLSFKKPVNFNLVQLRENIKLGQRIDSVSVEAYTNEGWAKIGKATSIGANRIIRLPKVVNTTKVKLTIYAPVSIALSEVGLYLAPEIAAVAVKEEAKTFPNNEWKVLGQEAAAVNRNAFDNNTTTVYQTEQNNIALDFSYPLTFSAITYLPAQDKSAAGSIEKYELLASEDGKVWKKIAEGEFSNIKANPILQRIALDKPYSARYLKLVAVQAVPDQSGKPQLRVAEIEVYR